MVVVYFLFQGLYQSIMTGVTDSLKGTPMMLKSVIVYLSVHFGLAFSQNNMQNVNLLYLQVVGILPVFTVNSGVMNDITTKAKIW